MKLLNGIIAILAACVLTATAFAASANVDRETLIEAHSALQAGEASKALNLLQAIPESGPQAASAQNLKCRVRYMLQQWSAAAKACTQAVKMDGQNSNYHLWLGRALGEEARSASFLSAFSLGKQVRVEFQTAVRLDPRNGAALSALGEFYVDAPSFMGGGLDKAGSVAQELDRVDPVRAAVLRARIAMARKDYGTAEGYFKEAIADSEHPSRQWATLASFYRRQKQWQQMEWAVRNCAEAAARDPQAGVALFNGASVLIEAKQDPALAAQMLEDYLASPSKTEEGPAFVAHRWLARLKAQLGDAEGAQQEEAAAKALAGEYLPHKDSRN